MDEHLHSSVIRTKVIFKGVVHFKKKKKKKLFLIIYSPPSSKMSTTFFLQLKRN